MVETEFTINEGKKSLENFEKIKQSIKGLFEILNINFDNDDFYFKAGLENLNGLYRNILELILNDYGLRQFKRKLDNSEVDIEIVLEDYIHEELEV